MTVADIMTSELLTAELDDTVGDITKIFAEHHIHHILVVEGSRILGVVSDRDILRATSPYANTDGEDARDSSTLRKKAQPNMTRSMITICTKGNRVGDTGQPRENRFNCLPVLSHAGAVVGILTKTDLLKCFLEQIAPVQA